MMTAQLLASYICMLWLIFILGFKIYFLCFNDIIIHYPALLKSREKN